MKRKYIILGILLTFMVLTLLGIISLHNHKQEIIHVKDLAFYTKRATIIRDDIAKIKDDTCKNSMNALFNRMNETHFVNDVTIKEYYQAYFKDNKTFMNFYEEAVKACKIEGNLDEIYVLALSSTNYPNEVKNRYLLSHEFIIKDQESRKSLSKSLDETGTYTTKALELQVINELLSRVKK